MTNKVYTNKNKLRRLNSQFTYDTLHMANDAHSHLVAAYKALQALISKEELGKVFPELKGRLKDVDLENCNNILGNLGGMINTIEAIKAAKLTEAVEMEKKHDR